MKAESIKLWLPSQLDVEDRDAICAGGVVNSEKELRFAQLEDALDGLRQVRRIRYGLITYYKVQLAGEGQRIQTQSQGVMQTIQDRINKLVRRYRVARGALLCLDLGQDWQNLYLPLTDNDNRGPGKEPEEVLGSDGQFVSSWIWRSSTTTVSPDEVNQDMRVEWAQCVARADRWEEEVILLQEEMRRTVEFLEWRSSDWLTKVDLRMGMVTPTVHAGLAAYARKQSAVFHNLAVQFSQRWRSTLITLSLPHSWATQFLSTCKQTPKNSNFKKRKRREETPPIHPDAGPPPPIALPPITSSPVVPPSIGSPPISSADIPLPPMTPETTDHSSWVSGIDHDSQVSSIDSDGMLSVCSGSGYESDSSWFE